jgi:GNAT superfamily N-acetyltransferase
MMDQDPLLTLKIATPDDARHLARLNMLFNQCDEAPEAYAARLADPQRVDIPILALRAELAVGVANLRLVQPVFYPQPYAEVTELFVLEDYRRQGVGRRLLAFAEQLARDAGAEEILVLTDFDNEAALSLYHSSGYGNHDLALSKSLV